MSAIAIGDYPNDHHYPGFEFKLQPKSMRWGGRWTGTAFTVPYAALVPETIRGLLVCEKNISVSHIANGSTRLQPMVMGIGQAAGMAAALCLEQHCDPVELPARSLQDALIADPIAPSAVIPLLDLPPAHPDWQHWQHYYLDHPEQYPADGRCGAKPVPCPISQGAIALTGELVILDGDNYQFTVEGHTWDLIATHPTIHEQLQQTRSLQRLTVTGRANRAGNWFIVEQIG
jgi:hypothetical protein